MAYGPPASHKENYVSSWLQDTVEAHQLLLDKISCFTMSDFGGTHATFRLMITCAVRCHGFLLRTLPSDICRMYLEATYVAACTAVFRIWVFLRTYTRSINIIVFNANFPYPRSLGA
jgi:hypothetical protein